MGHGFDLDYKFFEGKTVLEVGCGPVGMIYELDNTMFRVGLEPMDLEGLVSDRSKRLEKEKKCHSKMVHLT